MSFKDDLKTGMKDGYYKSFTLDKRQRIIVWFGMAAFMVIVVLLILSLFSSPASAYPTRQEIWDSVLKPTATTTPVCNCQKLQPVSITNILHRDLYNVMVLDDIPMDKVEKALYFTPNIFGYVITSPDETKYTIDQYNVPIPNEPYTIIIHDTVKRNSSFYSCSGVLYNKYMWFGKNKGNGKIVIGIDSNKVSWLQLSFLVQSECFNSISLGFESIDTWGDEITNWKERNMDSYFDRFRYVLFTYLN